MVHSLGYGSSCTDIIDNVIPYLFAERVYLISYYLNAPDFLPENHEKILRAQRMETFIDCDYTFISICTLTKHWNSWVKGHERIGFIAAGEKHPSTGLLLAKESGESPGRRNPLLWPVLKEEFECCKRPSFVNSRHRWFALTALCCMSKNSFSAVSTISAALVINGRPAGSLMSVSPIYFLDLVALQIYRIFLPYLEVSLSRSRRCCKRSEDVGFIDLAYIAELPMPEILHLLQDQAIAIVCELCDVNKSNRIDPEIQSVCLLMLQIMEMALYLEFCVLQICGIGPELERVEDFSREVKSLLKALEGHVFLKASMKSMKQKISLVYPGLLQTEGFL